MARALPLALDGKPDGDGLSIPVTRATVRDADRRAAWAVRRSHLLLGLMFVLLLDNGLLLPFLGVAWPMIAALGLLAIVALAAASRQLAEDDARISLVRFGACFAIALLLVLLGGEGGLFYANTDWQVRTSVLQDMAGHAWPIGYAIHGEAFLLRAPIGMYLLPTLGGPWLANGALVLQNTLLLATLLALGSTAIDSRRGRWTAMAVLIAFSGMDALGALFVQPNLLGSLDRHLEAWGGLQFSSDLTLLFWVPQHAIAGWIGAMLYLLWRKSCVPVSIALMAVPLVAIWSPFAMAGALPFVALAGWEEWRAGRIRVIDLLPALAATAVALPALVYMTSGMSDVGTRIGAVNPRFYGCVESFEVLPFLLCLAGSRTTRRQRIELGVIGAVLLAVPFVWVGRNCDFMMRASVPALAILAVLAAEQIASRENLRTPRSRILIAILLIGAITPLHEVVRAVRYRPAPLIRCTLIKAFEQTYGDQGISQYVAPVRDLPRALRPTRSSILPPDGAAPCWDRPWMARR